MTIDDIFINLVIEDEKKQKQKDVVEQPVLYIEKYYEQENEQVEEEQSESCIEFYF